MLLKEKIKISDDIKQLVKKYGKNPDSLLKVLQSVQKSFGYIPDFAMHEIERQLSVSSIDIHQIISFNKFLKRKPKAKNIVMFCNGLRCSGDDQNEIINEIEETFKTKIGETTPDGKFMFKFTNCLGMCHLGPVMTVNDRVYREITKEKALNILKSI